MSMYLPLNEPLPEPEPGSIRWLYLNKYACTSAEPKFEVFHFDTLNDAFAYAEAHPEIWKISFEGPNGVRIRLFKQDGSGIRKTIPGWGVQKPFTLTMTRLN